MLTKCPACGRRIRIRYETGQLSCSSCGWGTGQPASVPEGGTKRSRRRKRSVPVTNLTNVSLLWLGAGGVTALAAWIVFDLAKVEATNRNLLFFVGGLVAYAVIGYLVQPGANEEGSNWLFDGPGFSNCPEDRQGENNLFAAIAFLPGLLVGAAFVHTFRLIRQVVVGKRVRAVSDRSGDDQTGYRRE